MKHTIRLVRDDEQNPNRVHRHLLNSEFIWIFYSLSMWRFFWVIKTIIYVPLPPIMLTISSRIVDKVWASSPPSFQHVIFWCPFLDSYPNYTPLKYRISFRITNWIGHIYLTQHNGLIFILNCPSHTCSVIKSNLLFSVNLMYIVERLLYWEFSYDRDVL